MGVGWEWKKKINSLVITPLYKWGLFLIVKSSTLKHWQVNVHPYLSRSSNILSVKYCMSGDPSDQLCAES